MLISILILKGNDSTEKSKRFSSQSSLQAFKILYLQLFFFSNQTYLKNEWRNSFIVSSPTKIKVGGVVVSLFWNLDKEGGSWKNCSELGCSLKEGVLLERGIFQIASSVFLKNSTFSLLLQFLPGKYSHLLQSIDLLFHMVYFLLENNVSRNFFSSYSYF